MKKLRILAGVILGLIVFVSAVYIEVHIRDRARTAIPVDSDVSSASVSAYVQPDFLWAGKAWWIEVESDVPLALDIDGQWHAAVPAGTHRIHSNHDVNNTRDFSNQGWFEVPSRITIREN